MTRILCFSLLLISTPIFALNSTHCLKGCPNGSPATNDVMKRPIYVLSNNGTTKFADWVAYKVIHTNFPKKRSRNWKQDPNLTSNKTLEKSDYDGANAALKTDRGHQAPLGSFGKSPHWAMTNYLSNITPQKAKLNQGVWKALEGQVRQYAKKWKVPVYVVTGPLYESTMPSLPGTTKSHRIPSGYWKVIATLEEGTVWATGFVFNQTDPSYTNYCDYWSDIDSIEAATGLDFMPKLSGQIEHDVEVGAYDLWYYMGCEE